MKIFNYHMVESVHAGEETKGVKVRWLISKDTGAENFAMRLFEVEPGGYTPLHSHPWEHEIFILKGEGTIRGGEEERTFKEDDVIFISIEEKHQIRNTGGKKLKFICLVPF